MVNWLKTHKANILICLLFLPLHIENTIDVKKEDNISNINAILLVIITVIIDYIIIEGIKYLIKKGDNNESSNSI